MSANELAIYVTFGFLIAVILDNRAVFGRSTGSTSGDLARW
jgi:hypothetical protein